MRPALGQPSTRLALAMRPRSNSGAPDNVRRIGQKGSR
jgi:hypothetical protein